MIWAQVDTRNYTIRNGAHTKSRYCVILNADALKVYLVVVLAKEVYTVSLLLV